MLTISIRAFLHCNIGQMDESIIRVIRIQGELIGASPQIAFLTKVSISLRIKENPYSNVKLPLVNQKWSLDILLNDETIMFVFRLIHVSLRWSNGWACTTFRVWRLHLIVKFVVTSSYLCLSKLRFHPCLSLRSLVLQIILHIGWLVLVFLLVLSLLVGLVAHAQIFQIIFVYGLNVLWKG